jgi:hypothetical protein
MRSGLPSREWTHVWAGLGLHPTGGTRIKLRRTLKNCALWEAASVKFAGRDIVAYRKFVTEAII